MNEKRKEETKHYDRFPHLSLADKVPNMIDSALMRTSVLVIKNLLFCCARSVALTIAADRYVASPPARGLVVEQSHLVISHLSLPEESSEVSAKRVGDWVFGILGLLDCRIGDDMGSGGSHRRQCC